MHHCSPSRAQAQAALENWLSKAKADPGGIATSAFQVIKNSDAQLQIQSTESSNAPTPSILRNRLIQVYPERQA